MLLLVYPKIRVFTYAHGMSVSNSGTSTLILNLVVVETICYCWLALKKSFFRG